MQKYTVECEVQNLFWKQNMLSLVYTTERGVAGKRWDHLGVKRNIYNMRGWNKCPLLFQLTFWRFEIASRVYCSFSCSWITSGWNHQMKALHVRSSRALLFCILFCILIPFREQSTSTAAIKFVLKMKQIGQQHPTSSMVLWYVWYRTVWTRRATIGLCMWHFRHFEISGTDSDSTSHIMKKQKWITDMKPSHRWGFIVPPQNWWMMRVDFGTLYRQ